MISRCRWEISLWLGPAISLPIFTGGRIRSNVAVQNARWKQTQILYQSTILNALEETENALVNYSQEQERRDRLQAAVSQNQTALESPGSFTRPASGTFWPCSMPSGNSTGMKTFWRRARLR